MKIKLLLFVFAIPFFSFSQAAHVDSLAVRILDRMSDVIGELNACSFNLAVTYDSQGEYGLEKQFVNHEIIFKGPDKMLIQSKGNDFHKGYWYNGEHLVYYSYRENNFSVIESPNGIMTTIDSVHTAYEIDFPAADFFYPAFTDDLLAEFPTVVFLGNKTISGKDYLHILAENEKLSFQVWISNDALTLPQKFLITYKDQKNAPQYFAEFSEWKINPDFPDTLFDFIPPPEATQIQMLSKDDQ